MSFYEKRIIVSKIIDIFFDLSYRYYNPDHNIFVSIIKNCSYSLLRDIANNSNIQVFEFELQSTESDLCNIAEYFLKICIFQLLGYDSYVAKEILKIINKSDDNSTINRCDVKLEIDLIKVMDNLYRYTN